MYNSNRLIPATALAFALIFPMYPCSGQTSSNTPAPPSSLIENPFQPGLILRDTNGDSIVDAVCGHIFVPDSPTEVENTAAANVAARLGYETSALTLPIVTKPGVSLKMKCDPQIIPIWVGSSSIPSANKAEITPFISELQLGEGGVFAVGGGLAFVGSEGVGLLTATNAYAARAPFQWAVPGQSIDSIAKSINAKLQAVKIAGHVELVGLTYRDGQPGINRAILRVSDGADAAAIRKAIAPASEDATPIAIAARTWELRIGNEAPIAIATKATISTTQAPVPEAPVDEPRFLDLATLYGIKGLLSGSAKKMIPSSIAGKLYIANGDAGIAQANLAARMSLESIGLTLPIAIPASGVTTTQVASTAVIAGSSQLSKHTDDLINAPAGADFDKILPGQYPDIQGKSFAPLKPGEGELRVVDRAFGNSPALSIRGDERGSSTALDYASQHLPYLWEAGKKFASVEEVREDVQKFFSLHSSASQATAALYHLDQWTSELAAAHPAQGYESVSAEVDVDEADPKLAQFIHDQLTAKLGSVNISVKTGTLHAGTKCCNSDPDLHNNSQLIPFKQAEPTFAEDITIPWEGQRLLDAVKAAAVKLQKGQSVTIEARVSEGPAMRVKLRSQLEEILKTAGADHQHSDIQVLSAYKQGYSWLVDEIEPALKGKGTSKIKIEFVPYHDFEKLSSMRSISRWVNELFPVDEVLARDLKIPLANIELAQSANANGPTYIVHAYNSSGAEVLKRGFSIKTVARPYSMQFPHYETVNVATGWVQMTTAGTSLLDERIETDPEIFWDHYQTETLPRIFKAIMQQNDGKPKVEFQPLFDTLKLSFKMSEPDYQIGVDQERISSLEALQEDTFFSTQNFFFMMGDMVSSGKMDYQGRVIPVSYPSVEGQDGHVRIEYYAKDAGFPQVRLTWKIKGDTSEHEKSRELPALSGGMARLVAARVQADQDAVESLSWRLSADFKKDDYDRWIVEQEKGSVEHTVYSVEQASAQLQWIEKMHAAGLYPDTLAYPHLFGIDVEFELPLDPAAAAHTKNEIVTTHLAISAPPKPRPQIDDITPAPVSAKGQFVSWDKPIDPSESEHLLSRLATYPGVDVYWMGRTYLGRDIWAADILLPTPSALRSLAKETTFKAAIIYSGRQHANEVSSTSHLFRLAEQLVTDPTVRDSLKKVNVVIHPITNVDGAQLSIDLAKITPDFMLHPGYHAALTADLTTAQWDPNPIYPESATRRQLWQQWLPDAFLNPHGYPTHEWVQPFSEYGAWVITRTEAEYGHNNWVPRGWFTSLFYLGDEQHRSSKAVTYALRDLIVDGMAKTPGIVELNARMNDRYARFQKFDAYAYQQPVYKGTRIYMALKGEQPATESGALNSFMLRYPDVTYDDGYTEAPDETAYGSFLHLVASAGLAFDHAHLDYFVQGKYKITRTQKDFSDGVQRSVERERPVLPPTITDTPGNSSREGDKAKPAK